MLGADGLNLALMVADSGIIDSAVNDLMARSQVMMMAENFVPNSFKSWFGIAKTASIATSDENFCDNQFDCSIVQ